MQNGNNNESANDTEENYLQPLGRPAAPSWYHPVIYALGGIHVILAMCSMIRFFVKSWNSLRFDIPAITRIKYVDKMETCPYCYYDI